MKNSDLGPLTTIGDLTDQLKPLRDRLIEHINAGWSAIDLADDLNALATAEGKINAEHTIATARKNGATDDGIVKALVLMATRPVNDGYSGRTNDVRRAMHDGMIRRISEFTDSWAYRR